VIVVNSSVTEAIKFRILVQMQKKVLPFLFFLAVCLLSSNSFSQNKKHYREADSVMLMLSNKQLDSATAFNSIAEYLLTAYDYDSAYYYTEKASSL